MPTARAVVSDALMEIGALAQGQTVSAGDAKFGLGRLNLVLDDWSAPGRAIYADQTISFTLTPDLSPHTLGSNGATWTVTSRPIVIKAASVEINNTRSPITIRDSQWYAAQGLPESTSAIPSDLYPEYAWPNANLYFYPVPSTAYDVHLLVRRVLTQLTLDDDVDLPPGYQNALMLTTAEACLKGFGQPPDGDLSQRASKARYRAFSGNVSIPRLCSDVVGTGGGYYNIETGRTE